MRMTDFDGEPEDNCYLVLYDRSVWGDDWSISVFRKKRIDGRRHDNRLFTMMRVSDFFERKSIEGISMKTLRRVKKDVKIRLILDKL